MTKSFRALPVALLLTAACTKGADAPAAPALDPAVVAAQQDPDVTRAVEVTLALRQHPAARDSVFAALQITAAQFDSLKLRISADSNKKAAFISLAGFGGRFNRAADSTR